MQFIMPTLHKGSPGAQDPRGFRYDVELLHRALRRAGFGPEQATGAYVFTDQTEARVIAFQQANGLVPNGIVGPDTWAALPDEDMQGLPTLELGSEGAAVALVQRLMRRGGRPQFFPNGQINGVFDGPTDAAIKGWQSGDPEGVIVVDGIVGPQTWSILG